MASLMEKCLLLAGGPELENDVKSAMAFIIWTKNEMNIAFWCNRIRFHCRLMKFVTAVFDVILQFWFCGWTNFDAIKMLSFWCYKRTECKQGDIIASLASGNINQIATKITYKKKKWKKYAKQKNKKIIGKTNEMWLAQQYYIGINRYFIYRIMFSNKKKCLIHI